MISFTPHPEIAVCKSKFDPAIHKTWYKYDYLEGFRRVKALPEEEQYNALNQLMRHFVKNDLFFVVLFVMEIEKANHPFVVQRCRDLQEGPRSNTLDVWARGHWKSVIITQAETLQYHLNHPEECTGILAYARTAAKPFMRAIKVLCENSDLLKRCFPDIMWQNPQSEAPKWSEDDGLVFKRKSSSRRESTIEAWGLVEGMPTGRHFERLIFDDIETDDIKDSAEMLDKVFSKFEMAGNLSTMSDNDIVRVIGTYYSHFGPIVRIQSMRHLDDRPVYTLRKIPATDDGTIRGNPVYMAPDTFEKLKLSQHFNSQQLCDPTPVHDVKLNFNHLVPIPHELIPKTVVKFQILDQAGGEDTNKKKGDWWACGVFGIEPGTDNIGASNVYIMDLEANTMTHSQGIEMVVRMYLNGGVIRQLGVEKVSLSTTEIHISNALKEHGRYVSTEMRNLVLLKPSGRNLYKRIEGAIQWPLLNGKIHYSTKIRPEIIDRLRMEMEKFPFFHADILNIIAYLYDVIKDFDFSNDDIQEPLKKRNYGVV